MGALDAKGTVGWSTNELMGAFEKFRLIVYERVNRFKSLADKQAPNRC